jgi:internalin A
LTKLTLDLSFSQVSDLKPLEQLKGLQQLTLNLSEIQVSDLKLLEQLKGLQQLTLDLRDSQVSDLKPLEQLDELTSLDITLNGTSKEKNLEALLGKFLKMKSFSIAGATTEQRRSLRKIPASLVELKF